MIIEGLLNLVFGLFNIMLKPLPKLAFDGVGAVGSSLTALATFCYKANAYIPVDHCFIVLGIFFAINLSKFGIFFINWIIRRVADIIP